MIDFAILDALVASGATAETVVAAVRSMFASEEKRLSERRCKDAARALRNRKRKRSASANVRERPRTFADSPPPASFPLDNPLPPPTPEDGGGGGRAREPGEFVLTQAAIEFALEIAIIAGHDPEFLPPNWIAAQPAIRVQMMLNAGWRTDTMREAAKAAMRSKRDGPPVNIRYFDRPFARAHEPQLPLPKVQVVASNPEIVHVDQAQAAGGIDGRADWQRRRDAMRAAVDNLDVRSRE